MGKVQIIGFLGALFLSWPSFADKSEFEPSRKNCKTLVEGITSTRRSKEIKLSKEQEEFFEITRRQVFQRIELRLQARHLPLDLQALALERLQNSAAQSLREIISLDIPKTNIKNKGAAIRRIARTVADSLPLDREEWRAVYPQLTELRSNLRYSEEDLVFDATAEQAATYFDGLAKRVSRAPETLAISQQMAAEIGLPIYRRIISEEAAKMRERETRKVTVENLHFRISSRLRSTLSIEGFSNLVQSVVKTHTEFVRASSTLATSDPNLDIEIAHFKEALQTILIDGPFELNSSDRILLGNRIARAIFQIYKQPGVNIDEPGNEPAVASLPHTILARMKNSIDLKIGERISRYSEQMLNRKELEMLKEQAYTIALTAIEKDLGDHPPSLNPADEVSRDAGLLERIIAELDRSKTENKTLSARAESYRDGLFEKPRHEWVLPMKRLSPVIVSIVEEFASGAGSVGARESAAIDLYNAIRNRADTTKSPPLIDLIKWALTPENEKLSDAEFSKQVRAQLIPALTIEEKRYIDGYAGALEPLRNNLPIEQIILFDKVRGGLLTRIRGRVYQEVKSLKDETQRAELRDKRTRELVRLSIKPLQQAFAQEYLQPLARDRSEFEARVDRILNSASRGLLAEEAAFARQSTPIEEATPIEAIEPESEVEEGPLPEADYWDARRKHNVRRDMDQYLHDISKYPLLSATQERDAFKRLDELKKERLSVNPEVAGKANSEYQKLKDYIVVSNLRLGFTIANRYLKSGDDFMDLVQTANEAIMTCVDEFDVEFGYKFSTYAWHAARKRLGRKRLVLGRASQPSEEGRNRYYHARRLAREIKSETGIEPSIEELAKKMNAKPFALKRLLSLFKPAKSIEGRWNNNEDNPNVIEMNADPKAMRPDAELERDYSRRLDSEKLRAYINRLTRPHAKVLLNLHFGLDDSTPLTLNEIADRLGMTRQNARLIKMKALRDLREMIEADGMPFDFYER